MVLKDQTTLCITIFISKLPEQFSRQQWQSPDPAKTCPENYQINATSSYKLDKYTSIAEMTIALPDFKFRPTQNLLKT